MKRKRKRSSRSFGEKEFVKSVWKTMWGQEKKDPSVALLHERLEGTVRLIGLTGGIASGKSTVASFLRKEAHIPVVDADLIAREVVRPGSAAYRQIVSTFGCGVISPDGTLDRARLGEIVFADESKRVLLESITHPEIVQEIARQVRELKKKKSRAVVIDAPLLFESGLHRLMHKNLLVRTQPDIQMERLIKRDHLTKTQAWPRILSQMPTPEKERLADFIVDNSGTPAETLRQVREILKRL